MAAVDVIVVDGDNVAHARWRGRRGRWDVPRMRAELVDAVAGYAARVGSEAVVVFDGPGSEQRVGATVVLHSQDSTADEVIERLARELEAEGRSVAVVSADRALRQAVARASLRLIGPRDFLQRVEREAAAGGELRSRQRYQLGDALDAGTRSALERLRKGRPRA